MTLIYQITDTHVPLDQTKPAHQNFLRQIEFIEKNPADLLVISGDLPDDDGSDEIYRVMRDALPSGQAVAIIPGNHDDPALAYEIFGQEHCHAPDFFYHLPLEHIDLWFANTATGYFPLEQLEQLATARPSSVLFVHHPTTRLSSGFMDINYPLQNLDETHQLLQQSPISDVFCGHFHCEHTINDGYRLHVTPSAAFAIDLHKPEIELSFGDVPVRKIEIDGMNCRTEVLYLS